MDGHHPQTDYKVVYVDNSVFTRLSLATTAERQHTQSHLTLSAEMLLASSVTKNLIRFLTFFQC